MKSLKDIKSTKDIKVSEKISESIIGQDEALNVIKKASKQRRNVLLIGSPGTGKSLLGQALAELIPKEKVVDIISIHNPTDENRPLIKVVPQGEARKLQLKAKLETSAVFKRQTIIMLLFVILVSLLPYYFWKTGEISDVIYASSMITGMIFIIGFVFFLNISKKLQPKHYVPKILVDNADMDRAPFYDATGSHAGSLLGDVLHDPLQSIYMLESLVCSIQSNGVYGLKQLQKIKLNKLLDPLFRKHESELIKQDKYEAFFTEKDELQVLAENNKQIEESEVLSANRYPFTGNLIKITTETGKTLLVTPEHKVAVKRFGKIIYKAAEKLTRFDKVITLN